MFKQLLVLCLLCLGTASARAQIAGDTVVIGVLNNATGGLSAPAGPGSVIAAQMAIGDFGGMAD